MSGGAENDVAEKLADGEQADEDSGVRRTGERGGQRTDGRCEDAELHGCRTSGWCPTAHAVRCDR
jgi:hypothetical protein